MPPKQRLDLSRLALVAILLVAPVDFSLAQSSRHIPNGATGSLPSLGDNFELSVAAERRIGDRIAASIYRDPDYIDDAVLGDYLQGIWQPLMNAARSRGEIPAELDERFAWQVFLVRDRSLNAFALPGGYFGVHLGLIASVGSADEMAAVLGHELSHVTQRHIARLITQQNRQAPLLIAAMILGAVAASKSPEAAKAAIVGGQALAAQSQLNFSRDMEREADRIGFGVMSDAGFDSGGVTSMFAKLQQAARLNDNGAFPYLRSHPLTSERIAEVQARVQLAQSSAARPTRAHEDDQARAHVLHAMMAARARILAAPGVDALRAMVTEAQDFWALSPNSPNLKAAPAGATHGVAAKLMSDPNNPLALSASAGKIRNAGALYAGVFAAAQLRDFATARSLLARLKPLTEGIARANQVVELLAIEVDLLAGVVPPTASSVNVTKTSSRAEVLIQARSMLAAQRAPEVSSRLQTWVTAHPKDALAWQLLSQAYGNQNQAVRAIRADAESRVAQLDYAAALDRLKAAQALIRGNPASADYVEGSIIDARTRQVELLVKEQALQDKVDH